VPENCEHHFYNFKFAGLLEIDNLVDFWSEQLCLDLTTSLRVKLYGVCQLRTLRLHNVGFILLIKQRVHRNFARKLGLL
jgi:hypothetical protein